LKKFFLIFLISLTFTFALNAEESEERINLLYQKITALEVELAELRNLLEENSILLERSLELQQQRYMDLDSRILELTNINNNLIEESAKVDELIDTVDEEKLLYKSALELFEASRYAEALEVFSNIIISYPEGSFSADSYFWSGELFLAQELYEDAKLSYSEVVQQFPYHPRSADSAYKLGEIFRLESELEKANSYFESVILNFPDSGAAQLSKKSLLIVKEQSNLID
tara:strand:+ start:561 stop:1247 length:687 start_codon:yes stop_codon:yes gene_type:complete